MNDDILNKIDIDWLFGNRVVMYTTISSLCQLSIVSLRLLPMTVVCVTVGSVSLILLNK